MGTIFLGILALAAVVLVLFLIPTLLELKRTARSATLTLDTVRAEIRPVLKTLHDALREHLELTQHAHQALRRVEEMMDQATRLMGPVGRVLEIVSVLGSVSGVASLARAGRKGLEIFLDRLKIDRR